MKAIIYQINDHNVTILYSGDAELVEPKYQELRKQYGQFKENRKRANKPEQPPRYLAVNESKYLEILQEPEQLR